MRVCFSASPMLFASPLTFILSPFSKGRGDAESRPEQVAAQAIFSASSRTDVLSHTGVSAPQTSDPLLFQIVHVEPVIHDAITRDISLYVIFHVLLEFVWEIA